MKSKQNLLKRLGYLFYIVGKPEQWWLKGDIKSWVIFTFGNLVTSENFEWKWNYNFHLLLNFQTHQEHTQQEHTQSETQIYIYVFHMGFNFIKLMHWMFWNKYI
jgi:hypothetical protein